MYKTYITIYLTNYNNTFLLLLVITIKNHSISKNVGSKILNTIICT